MNAPLTIQHGSDLVRLGDEPRQLFREGTRVFVVTGPVMGWATNQPSGVVNIRPLIAGNEALPLV
jgi:hypothetical protein